MFNNSGWFVVGWMVVGFFLLGCFCALFCFTTQYYMCVQIRGLRGDCTLHRFGLQSSKNPVQIIEFV